MSLTEKVLRKRHLEECENGSGGVSSWNDLTDRPFSDHPYKLIGSASNSDINIEPDSSVGYYYVSDLLPPDNMDYIFVGLGLDGNEYEVTTVTHYPAKNYDAYFTRESNYPYVIVAFQDNVQDTDILGRAITFPKMGVYFYYSPGGGNTVTAFMGGGITKIDKKFLPDQVQPDWNETDETSPAFIMNKPQSLGGYTYYYINAYAGSTLLRSTNEAFDDYSDKVENFEEFFNTYYAKPIMLKVRTGDADTYAPCIGYNISAGTLWVIYMRNGYPANVNTHILAEG